MVTSGANANIMANWFPLALMPATRLWLMNLPEGSVESLTDLCEQFMSAFHGGYKRPGTMNDLHALIQRPCEMHGYFMQ
jgi:hypothetical protein